MIAASLPPSSSYSSSALLRAARLRFAASSSLSSPSFISLSKLQHVPRPPAPASLTFHRSASLSSALRSLRCSAPRWSHGADWRSPLSLRAQIRTNSPLIERFQRKIATMAAEHPFKEILTSLPKPGGGEFGKFYSLPALNDPRIEKLPYSIKILLESAIRNCDGFQVTKDDVEKIIDWENSAPKQVEIPFKPARVLLQDFTGVPAVVDLASMRDAMNRLGSDPNKINPLVPVDLVIDHSVQVDVAKSENAVQANMELEFQRNKERFGFLKWGSTAFQNMLVVPPGSGIVHQVNLEYLGRVVFNTNGMLYPDSVVGTDSHTTMIDGLGVAGWGVGGIEAEATMLGQDDPSRSDWSGSSRIKMDNQTRYARHRRWTALHEEQDPEQVNVYQRRRPKPKKSKNNDEAGPSTSHDPPASSMHEDPALDNTHMDDPPLYQNTSNVDPTWSVFPAAQQESAWYVPPAAEQTSDWPMWSGGMGGQAYWHGQQPHVEEPAQEQAHEQAGPTQIRRPRVRVRNAIEPKLGGPVPGDPEIPDLLFSFTAHTAYFIYQGIERPTLTFQLRQEQLQKWKLDDEYAWCDHARSSGLTHLQDLLYSYVDQSLISAFLERWQSETNSFHMPFGEMTITLLDVYMILGLHIEGQGMRLPLEDRFKAKNELYNQQAPKAIQFFSLTPEMAKNGVSADALKTHCLTHDLEDEEIASGYLWYLMASTLFPDKSQHMLPMPYVTFVSNIGNTSNLSWGSGALTFMYRSLGECSRHECRQMSTCYTLLLTWIYQYFPSFRPQANPSFDDDVPYARRWHPVQTPSRHRRNYMEELDLMQARHVDWQPYGYVNYDQPNLAPAFFHGVISFLRITEPYMPDWVARQFGVVQGIPRPVIEPIKAHRATTLRSYVVQYDPSSNWSWDARSQHSIWVRQMGPPALQGYECSADYMEWYIPRTHPCVRPQDAGIRDPVQVIAQALQRLNPFYNAEEEQFYNMRTAVRECIQDFRPYEHGNVAEEEDED